MAQILSSRPTDDDWRPLSWVNSICILFLAVGLLGLKSRPVEQGARPDQVQVVPVVFVPPSRPHKAEPKLVGTSETPQIASVPATPVVATVDPAQVVFPIPVESPVAIVAPRYALPPRVQTKSTAPVATEFNIDSATHGYFPKPKYPSSELAARHQGRVMLSIVLRTDGRPENVEVKESSGWPKLDNAAVEKVRKDWDFGPGPVRYFYVPLIFQIH